jgi:four helix bundle protein
MLDHQRLDVYRLSRELRREVLSLTAGLPRGHGEIVDQLGRAVLSIKLNIAEGSGEFAAKEKSRFYRMARRSAAEASAALDDPEDLGVMTPAQTAPSHKLTVRIVSSLIRLIQSTETARGSTAHQSHQQEPPR